MVVSVWAYTSICMPQWKGKSARGTRFMPQLGQDFFHKMNTLHHDLVKEWLLLPMVVLSRGGRGDIAQAGAHDKTCKTTALVVSTSHRLAKAGLWPYRKLSSTSLAMKVSCKWVMTLFSYKIYEWFTYQSLRPLTQYETSLREKTWIKLLVTQASW